MVKKSIWVVEGDDGFHDTFAAAEQYVTSESTDDVVISEYALVATTKYRIALVPTTKKKLVKK